MKPEWRTSTVMALCQAMRETQDFSACPILADALQDAGADDDDLLARLRQREFEFPQDAIVVGCIFSDEGKEACQWLENYATRYDHVLETMVRLGRDYLETGKCIYGGEELEGEYVPNEFWDKFQIVTGIFVGSDRRGSFFSCAC